MNDKRIFLTGGSGRIGQILLQYFLSQNYHVATTVRTDKSEKTLRNNFSNAIDKSLHVLRVDHLASDATVNITNALDAIGFKPTHLINNARDLRTLALNDDGEVSKDNFLSELHLQVVVAYELAVSFAKHYEQTLQGVINVASIYGIVAVHHQMVAIEGSAPPHYSVAKAALIQLTKELAVRFAKNDVNVNTISLGGLGGYAENDITRQYETLTPQGKMLNPEDIPGAFELLLSAKSKAITGHNLVIDGGWSIV